MVTEYIQAQTGDGGSIRTFNHRLGWTVTVLEWFFEGHFTAVLSIHQCWEPTYCSPGFLEWLERTHDRSTVYLTSLTDYLKCTVNQHVEVWLFGFSEDCVRRNIKLATGMDQRETTVLNTDTLCCSSTRGAAILPKLLIRECRMEYSIAKGLW